MHFSNDYREDLMARMAYHSNALENRQITLAETVSIILYNTVPPKMSLHNLYAIDNHKYAMAFLLKQDQDDLSIAIMTEIHTILTYRLQENQKHWDQIHKPMKLLLEETNKQLHSAKHEDEEIGRAHV